MARPYFIFGSQRSGTTMLLHVLGCSPRVEAFSEGDPRAMQDLRLRSLDVVSQLVERAAVPVLAFKPLCDAHYADHILRTLGGSRGIWIWRDFRDVILSAARMWPGHGREILARLERRDLEWLGWRGERLEDDWIADVTRFPADELSDVEAQALFWHLRNRVFFERGLAESELVLPVRYERLVRDPEREFGRVFAFLGVQFEPAFAADVVRDRVGRSPAPALREDIEEMCRALLRRLDAVLER